MSDLSFLNGSTALVTGANGFIGSHLVDQLLASGCTVHGMVRESSNLRWLDSSKVHLHKVDLTRRNFRVPDLEELDFVFHCAGLTKAKSRAEYFQVNATACSNLYEQCQQRGSRIKSIVHLSSLAATGPSLKGSLVDEMTPCKPVTFYGQSKFAGEEIALQYSKSLPLTVIRPPVVYGPREENFFNFIKLIQKGWGLQIGSASKELSLIYVSDLVEAMLKASDPSKEKGKNYFVTDGNVYVWEQIAKECARILNVHVKTLRVPEAVLVPVALFFEALASFSSKPALFDRQRMIDIRQSSWSASPESFFKVFAFEPKFQLSRGLTETITWCQQEKWL
ncbi:MAG: NAD-dependent epimerase/dehydratase family protein [Nitrospinae bacterium]|nr:NAD-dependent epimerase/dehydratase family protein [Nitrospinota bacterium]